MTAEQKFEKFFNSFPRYGTTLAEDWKKEIVELSKDFTEQKCKELLEIVAEKAKIKKEYYRDSNLKSNYGDPEIEIMVIDKDSILNAVNLKEFIK
jgi:hypothetical protein